MLKVLSFIKHIFVKDKIQVVDRVELEPVTNPLVQPNDTDYKFANPMMFRPPKVKFRIKQKTKK